jgi:glycosyltransferase involved in cell wall biosynthesis
MTPWAIMVTDVRLIPTLSGNRLRILGFIRALRALGWKVALVAPPDVAPARELRTLVDDVLFVRARRFAGGRLAEFDARPFRDAVNRMAAKVRPCVVVAQYAWLGPALSELPNGVRRWVDCHDLLHERTERFGAVGLDPWAACTWAEEQACLAHADVLILTQEGETARLLTLMPDKDVRCILTPVDPPRGFARRPGSGETVLTVGANHPGNRAVLDFARDAWPRVLARIPTARLHVVGGIGAALPPLPGVDVLGQVADLAAHYAAAAVVACPVTTGTGIKTKMLEAMRFGKAVVTTTIGVEGMPVPAAPAWIATETLDESADAIADLLGDAERRAAIEDAASAFAELHVAGAAFRRGIGALLPDIGEPAVGARPSPAMAPTVSVVITQTRGPQQLWACLRSVREQSYSAALIEIIVVFHTVGDAMLARIAAAFPDAILLGEATPGAAAARNLGAAHASGDVIAFLDWDCRADRNWLANAVDALAARDEDGIVASAIRPAFRPYRSTAAAWCDAVLLHELERADGPQASAILMRRHVWGCVGVPMVPAADSVVLRAVVESWAALREKTQLLAQGDARGMRAKIGRSLGAALRRPDVPMAARAGLVLSAALVRRWSNDRAGAAASVPRLPPRLARDPSPDCPLSFRSISVIVPSWGWPATLPACLLSVRAQVVDVPFEVIVAINGPHPPPAAPPEGIRIVWEPTPGAAAARNAGVRAAGGDVLAFIDADCVAAQGWLAAGLATLRGGGAGQVVAGGIARSGARRSLVALYDSIAYLRQEQYVRYSDGCVTANVFVHRATFAQIGPFDTAFGEAAAEDWEWALRARRAGFAISYAEDAVVDHPCMSLLAELKRKAERLARGELTLRRRLGQPVVAAGLFAMLGRNVRNVERAARLDRRDRLGLMGVAMAAGYWGWQAGRRQVRAE